MISLLQGDCVEVLRGLPDACIDAVVTDTPYGLSREPDMGEVLRHWIADDLRAHAMTRGLPSAWADALFPAADYSHTGGGFMGKRWDSFVPSPSVWREVLRVLKPGAHVLAFGGTRTYDMMVLAARLAGFEIRDQLAWLYGEGFPKSLNIAKQSGCEGWSGWGTALKPAQEPIVLARKPLIGTVAANVLAHGTGGINVDGCKIGSDVRYNAPAGNKPGTYALNMGVHGMPQDAEGSTVAGRWPANVLLDEDAAAMLDEQSGVLAGRGNRGSSISKKLSACYGKFGSAECGVEYNYNDSGGASRFFYCAKPSQHERAAGCREAGLEGRKPTAVTKRQEGSAGQTNPRAGMTGERERFNWHPTVKPIALMRYLVRLITPPSGWVLDPYNGSGTTGCAAVLEGRNYLGIDIDLDENGETAGYLEISAARIAWWAQHGSEL